MSWRARGWQVFDPEPAVTAWVDAARGAAQSALDDPVLREKWLRHGGTWFVGVDVLGNDADGRLGAGPPLAGAAREAAVRATGVSDLHKGQVSVTYPGYPRRDAGETEAAHRFRLTRDAAHLDGLLPVGPTRRRMLREYHAYILGLPLTVADAGAAPLVVWEGSHKILRAGLEDALAGIDPECWPDIDLTEAYHAARRKIFETCTRRKINAAPGAAILLHRMVLHGVAPWEDGAQADPMGRTIAYFRPEFPDRADYLGQA